MASTTMMAEAGSTAVPQRKVPTRRVSFEESLAKIDRHYALDGDLLPSHFFAALSSMFPDGEDFFVRSVRHFRSEITDPELSRQVSGFIGQESIHGREHRAFNRRLAQLGYPTLKFEAFTRWGLKNRERICTPKANLAATAALEHFTATLAELMLTDEEARMFPGEPAVHDLFLWHALEECEHKSVAYDVYCAVGGSERTRVLTMKGIRIGLIVAIAVQMAISLSTDPATYEKGRLRASFRRFRATPMFRREIWQQLREYDRPGFHPDDRDTTELAAYWREILFGENGLMLDRLAGSRDS